MSESGLYYERRRLFTDAFRERVFEALATLAGVIGGLQGALGTPENMLGGSVKTAFYYSLGGSAAAVLLTFLLLGRMRVIVRRERNYLERALSVLVSALGGAAFGLAIGGAYGYLMYLTGFYKIYKVFLPANFVLHFDQVSDPIIAGALGGAIGNAIGTLADGIHSLGVELVQPDAKKFHDDKEQQAISNV